MGNSLLQCPTTISAGYPPAEASRRFQTAFTPFFAALFFRRKEAPGIPTAPILDISGGFRKRRTPLISWTARATSFFSKSFRPAICLLPPPAQPTGCSTGLYGRVIFSSQSGPSLRLLVHSIWRVARIWENPADHRGLFPCTDSPNGRPERHLHRVNPPLQLPVCPGRNPV